MSTTPPKPTPQVCPGALADFAAAVRPDWDRQELGAAITGALVARWPWPHLIRAVLLELAMDPELRPRDLHRIRVQLGPAHLLTHRPEPASAENRARYLQQIRDELTPPPGQTELPLDLGGDQ
ncbi:hypothetical protein [Nocardiopsis dassonvillei]|uniref:hypothetical protein n=1 Tax=Nocardiopsis dassonvillei TaxID=2014 RepID=UPI003632E8B4